MIAIPTGVRVWLATGHTDGYLILVPVGFPPIARRKSD